MLRDGHAIYDLEASRSARIHGALYVLDDDDQTQYIYRESLNLPDCVRVISALAAERPRDWTRLDFKHLNSRYNRPATMASQTSGILRWASSITNSMINDPGRQFFEDQVQSQGFLFLEEYLDNIWSSARQE
jgi:hypothetical protein